MVGAPDVVQPWMPRAARDSDACLWHVSVAGGARRRGCAAAGVPEFFNGPLALERPAGARPGADAAVGHVDRLARAVAQQQRGGELGALAGRADRRHRPGEVHAPRWLAQLVVGDVDGAGDVARVPLRALADV